MSLILLVSGGAGIGWSWWRHHQISCPPGIAYGQWSVRTRREVRGPHREALRRPRRYRGAGQVVAMMQTEPDKLMFRIRVWIAPERFKGHEAIVRSGLPGIAYVRTEPSVVWAPSLQLSPPPRARRRCGSAWRMSRIATAKVTVFDGVTLALSAGRAVGLIGPASQDSIRKLWGAAGLPPAANRRRTCHGDNRTCTRRVYAASPRAERECRSARLHSGRRPYLMARPSNSGGRLRR